MESRVLIERRLKRMKEHTMKIKQLVKIWLCERPSNLKERLTLLQVLAMPEEYRHIRPDKGWTQENDAEWRKLLFKGENIHFFSSNYPKIINQRPLKLHLRGYEDWADSSIISVGSEWYSKQQILSAFDDWSGGLRVHCDEPDTYAWLMGENNPVDCEKARQDIRDKLDI